MLESWDTQPSRTEKNSKDEGEKLCSLDSPNMGKHDNSWPIFVRSIWWTQKHASGPPILSTINNTTNFRFPHCLLKWGHVLNLITERILRDFSQKKSVGESWHMNTILTKFIIQFKFLLAFSWKQRWTHLCHDNQYLNGMRLTFWTYELILAYVHSV